MREITTNNNDVKSGHICLWRETGFARNEMGTDPAEWMEFRQPLFSLAYRWFGLPAAGRKAEPLVWGGAGSS